MAPGVPRGGASFIGTAVVWRQAREIDASNRRNHEYIIASFPILDRLSMQAMTAASHLVMGTADAKTRRETAQVFTEALGFYQKATDLPRHDAESRIIIARAHKQLGFSRAILSLAARHSHPNLLPHAGRRDAHVSPIPPIVRKPVA